MRQTSVSRNVIIAICSGDEHFFFHSFSESHLVCLPDHKQFQEAFAAFSAIAMVSQLPELLSSSEVIGSSDRHAVQLQISWESFVSLRSRSEFIALKLS